MDLKIETLQTAQEYVVRLKVAIGKVVEQYREDKIHGEDQVLVEIIDGLRWMIDVMTLTKDIHVGNILEDKIKENLSDMLDAFENNDKGLIADLFEYEVIDGLIQYETIINNTLRSS